MAKLKDLNLDPRSEFYGIYKTGRGRLAAFLSDLPPLFRRRLTGDGLNQRDLMAFDGLDERGRKAFKRAEAEYLKRLCEAASAHPRRGDQVDAELFDNARREAILYHRHAKAGGAPSKELGLRWEVLVSQEAERLEERLAPGVRRAQELRKGQRFAADSTNIRSKLAALGFGSDEIAAIMNSTTAAGAAAQLLAAPHYYGRPVTRIRAAITRGQTLRRRERFARTKLV